MFELDARLGNDTLAIGDLNLCRLLLMNNMFFPWLILVPRVENAREILDLTPARRHLLMDEIAVASAVMQDFFTPDKLNVAALGNQVPQLHVHVIARHIGDPAWPHPVWGRGATPYKDPKSLLQRLQSAFSLAPASSA